MSLPRFSPVVCACDFEPGAEPRADRIEPVGDDAGEVGLAGAEPLGHAGHPAVELGARLRERGEARLDRLLPLARRIRLAPARRPAPHQRDQGHGEEQRQRGQRRAERLREKDRHAVDDGDRGDRGHGRRRKEIEQK